MSIYERIELLIHNHGMTKKAFCSELNISTGNLGDWKRGKSTPSTNKLIEIAAFFDVSLDWLMTGREKELICTGQRKAEYVIRERENDQDWEIFIQTLNESEKRFIREYIEFTRYKKQKGQRK